MVPNCHRLCHRKTRRNHHPNSSKRRPSPRMEVLPPQSLRLAHRNPTRHRLLRPLRHHQSSRKSLPQPPNHPLSLATFSRAKSGTPQSPPPQGFPKITLPPKSRQTDRRKKIRPRQRRRTPGRSSRSSGLISPTTHRRYHEPRRAPPPPPRFPLPNPPPKRTPKFAKSNPRKISPQIASPFLKSSRQPQTFLPSPPTPLKG